MFRTALHLAWILVGGYLGVWFVVWLIHTTRGISDQDATFVVALAALWLSEPSARLVHAMGFGGNELAMVLSGCLQWGMVSFLLVAIHQMISVFRGRSGVSGQGEGADVEGYRS